MDPDGERRLLTFLRQRLVGLLRSLHWRNHLLGRINSFSILATIWLLADSGAS